jgi:hypothetical protein
MIGMHRGLRPRGAVEGLGGQGQERGLLHRLEHEPRDLARGAVHARAGDVAAPGDRAGLHLGQVAEGLAPEEVLAAVGNPALHLRLAGGVTDDGGIDDEATILRVLQEPALDRRRVAIRPRDNGLEIVLDEALDHAPEEHPGAFQAVDDGGRVLPQADREKRVAAEAERDEQAVHGARAAGEGILPDAQPAEIDLGGFARGRVGDPDGESSARRSRTRPGRTDRASCTRPAAPGPAAADRSSSGAGLRSTRRGSAPHAAAGLRPPDSGCRCSMDAQAAERT